MQQGTVEWLEWRRQGVGASETPVLMGESDFATPFELWERKRGIKKESQANFAMQRGADAENKIRSIYELEHGCEMLPALAQHKQLEFFRASLDGYNSDLNAGIEIKYPSAAKHAEAANGKVPVCYYGQVQHQLFVTGAKWIDYVSFDGKEIAVVRVEPDAKYIEKMIPIVSDFWECVKTGTPPARTDKDLISLDDPAQIALFERFAALKLAADEAVAKADELNDEIKKLFPSGGVFAGGYELVRISKKGSVDYAAIPELKGVDLERYRKSGGSTLTLRPRKGSA